MKKLNLITITAATLLFIGCGGGGDSAPTAATFTEGKVTFADGTVLGVTRAEEQQNGGFNVYNIATGEIVGFIQLDGSVNDANGYNLGVCQNLNISENGLSGTCSVPTNPIATSNATSNQSGGSSNNTGTTNTPIAPSNPNTTTTTTTIQHPNAPQPNCSNTQPHLLPLCTGAPGEVPVN